MAAIYHRIENDKTQTAETARKQQASGEIWGRPRQGGTNPAVKAYPGPLPSHLRGIEFTADLPPDHHPPGWVHWIGPRKGVVVEGGFAKIKVKVTKNTQV